MRATPSRSSPRSPPVLVTTLVLGGIIPVGEANGRHDVRCRLLVDVDMTTMAIAAEVARVRSELTRDPPVKRIVSLKAGRA